MFFKIITVLFTVELISDICGCERFSYDGYSLLRLTPKTTKHIDLIRELQNDAEFDSWSILKGINITHDVLLSQEHSWNYSKLFKSVNLPFETIVENIQNHNEEQKTLAKRSAGQRSHSIVGKFARYSEIQSYILNVASSNPDIASTYLTGKTYEKRDLRVLVLKTSTSRRSVWIDCGIHAREWISPATCIWIINKLINEYKAGDSVVKNLLGYYSIHILPLMNPDGYEYSHTTNRFWRKNRNPNKKNACMGTDLNRNSGYQWMKGGSSSNPCSNIYAGPYPDSELEIQGLQRALMAKLGNWDAYLTLHTYGQWIFTPWGYTKLLPADYRDLHEKAEIGRNAILKISGNKWVIGSSTHILGVGSGGSEDWAKGMAKIKYSYCFELSPAQNGIDSEYGFALPENRISLAGEETYQGIKAMLMSIKTSF